MAEFTEPITAAKKQKAKFIKLQNALFPDGEIPSAESILEKLKTGNHTLRDALIAKMYEQGTTIAPARLDDPDTMEFAQKFVNSFDQETGGKLASSIADEIDSYKNIPLDTKFSDAILITKPNQKGQQVRVVKKELDTSIAGILGNEQKFLGTRAVKGSKKLVDGLLPEGILDDVLAGVAKIEDPVLKDAVLSSLLGYRGKALTESFATRELAVRQLDKPRPYYVPETGTFIGPPVTDKKGYGPDKPLGPLFKSIMDRRHAEAMKGKTGQLFPNITTAKITKALKDVVFANIRPEILAQLKRKPDGYTDMRRIVASEVANRLGDQKAAAAIIGHAKGKGDIDISVMTGYYADVVDEAEALARKDIYFAFEGAMAKALGGNSLQDLAGSLNIPLSDTAKDVVYPDFKQGDVSAGFAQQQVDLSPEEIKVREELNIAQMQENIAKKELSVAETEAKKIETTAALTPEQITQAATNEQLKLNLKAQIKNEQRKAQQDKINAEKTANTKAEVNKLDELHKNKWGPRVVKGGVFTVGMLPFVGATVNKTRAGEFLAKKAEELGIVESAENVPPVVKETAGFLSEAFLPVTPTDIKDVSDVGMTLSKPAAQAASQFEGSFLDELKSRLQPQQ